MNGGQKKDLIYILSVICAVISAIAAVVVVPECRGWFGLDKEGLEQNKGDNKPSDVRPPLPPKDPIERVNQQIESTAQKTSQQLSASTKKIFGYAFYGIRERPKYIKWYSRHFRSLDSDGDALPAAGTVVEATDDVNIRSGIIKWQTKDKAWVNAPSTGVLPKGSRLLVLSVSGVEQNPGFIWIKFETL